MPGDVKEIFEKYLEKLEALINLKIDRSDVTGEKARGELLNMLINTQDGNIDMLINTDVADLADDYLDKKKLEWQKAQLNEDFLTAYRAFSATLEHDNVLKSYVKVAIHESYYQNKTANHTSPSRYEYILDKAKQIYSKERLEAYETQYKPIGYGPRIGVSLGGAAIAAGCTALLLLGLVTGFLALPVLVIGLAAASAALFGVATIGMRNSKRNEMTEMYNKEFEDKLDVCLTSAETANNPLAQVASSKGPDEPEQPGQKLSSDVNANANALDSSQQITSDHTSFESHEDPKSPPQ